ncbi:cytochrome P450 6g1 [Musca domestica]|uniref:Cytochrome P450 6g1 n=1 Tax=Musca domestica TaxID=7370 RepID=A0A1I8MP60_MUSDO|nr:cytochrome P450 6g1 [Musca domestica]
MWWLGIIAIFLYILYKAQYGFWKRHPAVPSLPGRIFSGNLLDFLLFKTNFGYHLKKIYDDPAFTDKPVVGIYGLYRPSLLIREPELIKRILIKDFDCFHNRFHDIDVKYDPIGGQMMFYTSFRLWREMRQKLSPVFTSAKLKHMYPLIQNVAKNIEGYLGKQKSIHPLEMKNFCARYTSDIVATTLLGFKSNSLENPSEELWKEIALMAYFNLKRAIDFMVILFVPKMARLFRSKLFYKKTEDFLRDSITHAIKERELSGLPRNDLIDMFVKLREEAADDDRDMDKFMETLIAQGAIFIAAGSDTSSTTMSNALFELAKQPEVQKKLKEEIRQTFALDEGSTISYENLNNMKYLDMVINETLRLYPVLPILERKYQRPEGTSGDYSLKPFCDFELSNDMPIYISLFGLHYDPKYWSNPIKFDPERFSPENKSTLNPMAYLPFGMGPHNCIGSRLALLQMKCGLVHLLHNHHVRVGKRTCLKPEFETKSILFEIKGGIHLEVVKDIDFSE